MFCEVKNVFQVSGLDEHMMLIVKKQKTSPYAEDLPKSMESLLSKPLSSMHRSLNAFVAYVI